MSFTIEQDSKLDKELRKTNSFLSEYKELCQKYNQFVAGEDESACIYFAMDKDELVTHFKEVERDIPSFW
jgi:hypothetical protein